MARKSGLSSMTYQELQRELRRRERSVSTLHRRRSRLAARLEALDARIREMGGSGNGTGRGGGGRRARNESTLPEALHKVLTGKTMRVTEVAEAVQKAGYKTNSRTFRVQVNIA